MKGGIFEWALAATAALKRAVDSPPTCVTGVHMIVARGSGEPAGLGRISAIVNNVTLTIPGSDYTAVDYPATLAGYPESVAEGTAEFHRLIKEYTKACPDTKIALLGYSQGAHVLMDTVCGSDQEGFEPSPELADAFQSNIVAIVAVGDPTHIVAAPWNRGTSKNDGFFPRPSIAGCEPYSSMIVSYCDTGDVYCDRGTDRTVHGSYYRIYTQDAVKFIADKFKNAANVTTPSTTPSESSAVSSTATGTASSLASSSTGSVAPTGLTTSAPGSSTAAASTTATPSPSTSSVPTSGGNLFGPSALVLVAGVVLSLFA